MVVLTSALDDCEGLETNRALQGWGRRLTEAPALRGRGGDRAGDGGGVSQVDQLQRRPGRPGAWHLIALLLLGELDVLLGGVLDLDELVLLLLRVGGAVRLRAQSQSSVDGILVSRQVLL